MPFLQEQKTVTGAECIISDTKDYDITGAVFVTTMDEGDYFMLGKSGFAGCRM